MPAAATAAFSQHHQSSRYAFCRTSLLQLILAMDGWMGRRDLWPPLVCMPAAADGS